MKLEAVIHDRIYATEGRRLFVRSGNCGFEPLSTLPNPESGLDKVKYNLKTGGIEGRIRRALTGRVHSVNVWPIDDKTIFANANRWMFVSHDGGKSWDHSLTLRESTGLRGAMPCGLCHQGGTVYLGEYIFDETKHPRVLETSDFGETWETSVELEGVRHVHSVQVDPITDDIWITTGDRDDESIIGILRDDDVEVVGTGSQRWRMVQPVFLPDAILWGTDAPYQENQILRLPRSEIGSSNPDIDVLHTETNPFYFGTSIDGRVFISTSASAKEDSTAPDETPHESDSWVTVWTASETTAFREWMQVARYQTEPTLARRFGLKSLMANSYAFLDSSPSTGVVVGPYNCTDGELMITDPQKFNNERN
ncbi:glycosyl hydrolase [Natrialbaceae archaeon A-CW1-1]